RRCSRGRRRTRSTCLLGAGSIRGVPSRRSGATGPTRSFARSPARRTIEPRASSSANSAAFPPSASPLTDTDVIVVGAGPTGLMLACERGLAGVQPLVLERFPQIRDVPKAGGLSGQILELLRFRGELERFEAAGTAAIPAPRLPWGGMHVDFSPLEDPPVKVLPLPQPELERVLDDFARELGAEIRRGHEVVGLSQDESAVTAEVRGPDGPDRVTARYLVGCDG